MIHILPAEIMQRIGERLAYLYGEDLKPRLLERIALFAGRYGLDTCPEGACEGPLWDQTDAILITYGDMVRREGEAPLAVLHRFLDAHLQDAISGVHVLPFFPYSSDDGFSVIDFRQVDPALGDWDQIRALGKRYRLMVDLVLNHCSRESAWFRNYTNGIAPERDYFIEVDPDEASGLDQVVRPRSLPLLTPTQTAYGERHLWTTFSSDQIDLNYANQDVLFEILDILLLYIYKGARIVRLDAIAYLWKELGTPCIHLPQTHQVVKLMRDLLEMLAPGVILLTETNVPHAENIAYFGDGDEARMVYQFSLPPLLLHALHTGNARYLHQWAAELAPPPPGCTWFNFTASHDGIGVRPLEGLIPPEELDALVTAVERRGGRVSTRTDASGREVPYELNITYFDALSDPGQAESERHIARFLCSQAIMLGLQGIPGIYFNSLVGGRNNQVGFRHTGRPRTLNRQKWDEAQLTQRLADTTGAGGRVFKQYRHLLQLRRAHSAFHPDAPQQVLDLDEALFGFVRTAPDGGERLIALHNLSDRPQDLDLASRYPDFAGPVWCELIQGQRLQGDAGARLHLAPYQTLWLTTATEPDA